MKKILLFTSILFLTITTSLFAQHPINLVASNITASSVELSWDDSMCGSSTYLRYRESGTPWIVVTVGVSTPYLLSGLNSSSIYDFQAKCQGISGWSANAIFTTTNNPIIDSAYVSDSIACFDSTGAITIGLIQTIPATSPLEIIVGYAASWNPNYIIKQTSAVVNSLSTIVVPGLFAKDYVIRLVDPVAYFAANANGSGTSLNGVYDEYIINLDEPNQLIASTSVIASNLCHGDSIAQENLDISGGTKPYSFALNANTTINLGNNDSIFSFVALSADSYDIVVTDINGCSTLPVTTTFTISTIPLIVTTGTAPPFNSNGYNISCYGASDGIINASALGGTGSFTFSIDGNNFQSNPIFSGTSAGFNTISYRDSNNCIGTQDFTLTEPPVLLGASSVTQDVDCYNAFTGEITFTVDPLQPGVPPYQYSNDNGVNYQSSAIFPNLLGNINYDIMVMDNNGCPFNSTVYLAEPAQLIYSTILSNYNGFEVSCVGLLDGNIEFNSTIGGLPPYEYSTDGGLTFSFSNLYPNLISETYNLKVKDSTGCIDSSIVILEDPGFFSVPFTISNAVDCPGDCSGAISINPINGVGQVLYNLDSGVQQTTPYFSGICGDITNPNSFYTLSAVDDNGCVTDTTFSLIEPTDFVYTTASTLEYCAQSNGQASISVTSGGTGSLSYIWNNDTLQNSAVANNLLAGTYSVLVTDANDCQITELVTVSEDVGFTVFFTRVSPCLGDSSGSATVSSTTGIPNYSYQWSNINGIIIGETSATISNMPVGSYTVEVTDATTCVISGSIDIISPVNQIVIDSVVVTNSSCFGIDDAQIELFSSGGLQPYSYSNTNGLNTQINPVFGMLAPNTYSIQAIDLNGCFDDTSITLSYPALLEIDSTVFSDVSCFGFDDGSVQNIQFVGGTAPFEFSIDGNISQTNMLFLDLNPGQHTVEVIDVNNCVSSDLITIIEPDLLDVLIETSGWVFNSNSNSYSYQIKCNGDNSGFIDISSLGGTQPYLINGISFWDTINIDGIFAGNQNFVIEDANGCTYQETILFEEPSPIEHNFITNHVSCVVWNNGSVTDSVYGGVGSATTYSYLWDSGETTYSLDNLSTGSYSITVTDENGCQDTESVTINANSALQVDPLSSLNIGCFDDCDGELSVIASGGVPFSGISSYNYIWNDYLGQNTSTALALCVDTVSLSTIYNCIVTDASGCEVELSLTLEQPEQLHVDVLIIKPISCNGSSDAVIKAVTSGGVLNYTYTWSNSITTATNNNLSPGVYKVIVEDANTCRDTFEIYLNEPDSLEIEINDIDIACFGVEDGYIQVLGSGGVSFEYTYLYTLFLEGVFEDSVTHMSGTNLQDSLEFNSLVPGNYYVIIEDRNGCESTSLSVEITEPFAELTVLVDSVNETCLLNAPGQNGIIRVYPVGGSQVFSYIIDGNTILSSDPDQLISDPIFTPGWHYITVVDSRGCQVNDTTYIKAYDAIFLPDTLTSIDTTICLGQSINIEIEEMSDLTYTWNDGFLGGSRSIKPDGILPYGIMFTNEYFVTVTDIDGCEIQNTVTVNFDAINPLIDSDPGVVSGDFPVVLEGNDISLFSNNNNGIEYSWQWDDNIIINAYNSITIPGVLSTDWYHLVVKDTDGCLGYDSIYVVVGVKAYGESTVYEAITPNNDGFNDTWTPLNIESYEDAIVQVFNRWGGLVFTSRGGNNYQAWDGTHNGKELVVGTYYYIIDLKTGDEIQSGPVTIIR